MNDPGGRGYANLSNMDVSICIVNWNVKDLLYNCIMTIHEKTKGIAYEIIVLDNASSDGSNEMIKKQFPECNLIESRCNLGFAKGNNLAVSEASAKYILYLNPDTALVTAAVRGMFSFLEKNAEYGAVGCKLTDQNGTIQYTCAATFPTPFNVLSSLLLLNRIFPKSILFASRELNYWDHEHGKSVDCLSGACMMVRKKIIDRIGGFDEKIFMYSEDLDLCYRILKDGWKIYYLATEEIIHSEGASTKVRKNRNFSSLMQKASNYYFLNKHFGLLRAIEFRLAVFIGSSCRIIFILLVSPILILKKHFNLSDVLSKYSNIFLWSLGLIKTKHLVEK